MKVVISEAALDDLDKLHRYISMKSYESRADAYIGRIEAFCMSLDLFPERGSKRDDILLGLRVIGFEKSASIAFVVMEDHVVIEGVFYGGRSVEKSLKPRK